MILNRKVGELLADKLVFEWGTEGNEGRRSAGM